MRPSRCATRTPAASRLAQPKRLRHERGGGANRREAAAPSESERGWGPASIRIDRPSARARRAATPSSDVRGRIRSNRSGGARSTRRPRRASRGMPRRWRHRAGGTPDSSRRLYYNRARMTPVWGLLAAAALLWPDRISGPFDGVPLDRVAEAIAAAVVFPILWWLHPRFLTTRIARAAIVLLIVWKACATAIFVQDGWCVRFVPSRPYFKDARGAPHAWDMRAAWRSPDPACSAIMTRSYRDLPEFPAWFFNLPPPSDSWPLPADRPPGATVAMRVHGFVSTPEAGVLQIDTGSDVTAATTVDGVALRGPHSIAPGVHFVAIDAVLTGDRWSLIPRWNGQDLWS